MIAVATWKLWVIPFMVVFGVIGFLLRGLVDMAENFETGSGPNSRKATRQAFGILTVFILVAIIIGLFGCSTCPECHSQPPPMKWIGKNLYLYDQDKWEKICEQCLT